jgi:hypothetical protein
VPAASPTATARTAAMRPGRSQLANIEITLDRAPVGRASALTLPM